jgi:hypothetical protein
MSRLVSSAVRPSRTTIVTLLQGAILVVKKAPALDRMSISAGAFFTDPKIHLGGDTNYGRIDTPNQKLDNETLPRVKAEMLFGDKHGVALDYFRFDEDYSGATSGSTVYEGRPVSGNISAEANLRIEMARLSYKYWIGQDKNAFGIGLGAAYLRAKISGSGVANLSASAPTVNYTFSGSSSGSDSVWAPTIDLAWRHALNDKVRLYAEASGIKRNGGTVEGHVYNAAAGVEWMATPRVSLVADYGIQKIDLHRNGGSNADLDLKLTGPSAFVKVRF